MRFADKVFRIVVPAIVSGCIAAQCCFAIESMPMTRPKALHSISPVEKNLQKKIVAEQKRYLEISKKRALDYVDPVLEQSVLERLALLKGSSSHEYLLELIRYQLKQGAAFKDKVNEEIKKICEASDKSFECIQASALNELSSSQMKIKLKTFAMYETNRDYENAVKAIDELFGEPPKEHSLRLRYFSMMGNIEGREKEAIRGLKSIIAEDPYDSVIKFSAKKQLNSFTALDKANRALQLLKNDSSKTLAEKLLKEAIASTENAEDAAYWTRRLNDVRYYRYLDDADKEYRNHNLPKAEQLYKQAIAFNGSSPYAYIGLAKIYIEKKDTAQFERNAKMAVLTSHSESKKEQLRITRSMNSLRAQIISNQAEKELLLGNTDKYIRLKKEALRLDDSPWDYYEFSTKLLELNRKTDAYEVFESLGERKLNSNDYVYPYALVLSKAGDDDKALMILEHHKGESSDIDEMHKRLSNSKTIKEAEKLFESGNKKEAYSLLELNHSDETLLKKADFLAEEKNYKEASLILDNLLIMHPNDEDILLKKIELDIKQNNLDKAKKNLAKIKSKQDSLSLYQLMNLADCESMLNQNEEALETYNDIYKRFYSQSLDYTPLAKDSTIDQIEQEVKGEKKLNTENETAVLSDEAKKELIILNNRYSELLANTSGRDSSDAIRVNRKTLALISGNRHIEDDDALYTAALRTPDKVDEYYISTAKKTGAQNYQKRNVIITDGIFYTHDSGHPGYSDNRIITNILNATFPMGAGRGTLQIDTVHYDAGRLSNEPYEDSFGLCRTTGCGKHNQVRTNNTIAFAYDADEFHFDIGNAPRVTDSSFKNDDIVGALQLKFDLGRWTIKPDIHRRAKDNSMLSYFGQEDKKFKNRWGGVKSTGFTLSSSYYHSSDLGFWNTITVNSLKGHNVKDNFEFKAMAGVYKHLIDEPNEQLTLSPSVMLWHFDKNLSEYTYGHGGYYSPQKYISSALTLAYKRRTEKWSYLVEGSGSFGYTKKKDTKRYYDVVFRNESYKKRFTEEDSLDDIVSGDSGPSWGYAFRGAAEYRVTSNLVLGSSVSVAHSSDYTPAIAGMYFRYYLFDYNGDLPMPPSPPVPYTQW